MASEPAWWAVDADGHVQIHSDLAGRHHLEEMAKLNGWLVEECPKVNFDDAGECSYDDASLDELFGRSS